MLRHALWLAANLGPVFQLAPRSKVPRIAKADGGNGACDATADERQIRALWMQCPDGNIALTARDFLVIDVDPRNGGDSTWDRLCEEHGEPQTLTQQTGSAGLHYLFQRPDFDTWSKNKLYPGIDVIVGAHRYILASPSVHPNGNRYRWLRRMPPAELPSWLAEIVRRPAVAVNQTNTYEIRCSQSTAFDRATKYLSRCPVAISGSGGHQTTFEICLKLAGNFPELSEEYLWILLQDWNANCQPPWNEQQLRHKLNDALRSVRGERAA